MIPDIASLWIGTHPDFEDEIYMLTSKTVGIAYFLTCLQTGEEIMVWSHQLEELFKPFTGPQEADTCK